MKKTILNQLKLSSVIEVSQQTVVKYTSVKHRLQVYTFVLVVFIMLELMWRMIFEFFIAYFQMHAALVI